MYYFLDPDNRKKVPEVPHCERCKKPIKDISKALKIEYRDNDACPYVKLSETGSYIIGKDCWEIITKEEL